MQRNSFKVASQLEPYIRSLTPAQQSQSSQSEQGQSQSEQAQHLASLLEHIGERYYDILLKKELLAFAMAYEFTWF